MFDEAKLHYLTVAYEETIQYVHQAVRHWIRPEGRSARLTVFHDEIVYRSWQTHVSGATTRPTSFIVLNQACNRALEALFPQAENIRMSQLYDLIEFARSDRPKTQQRALRMAKTSAPTIPRRLRGVLVSACSHTDAMSYEAAGTAYIDIESVLTKHIGNEAARMLLVRDTLHLDGVHVPNL